VEALEQGCFFFGDFFGELAIFIFISNRRKFCFFGFFSCQNPPSNVTRFYPELQQVAQNIEGLDFFYFQIFLSPNLAKLSYG